MILLHYPAPGAGNAARTLLVMLPGAGIEAADFAAHGMVAAVHDRGLAVDITTIRPDIELYLDGGVAGELQTKIISPALAAGYRRIWLLGISLGGMGVLQYAERHAPQLAGIILLAPFLGTQGTIADIAAAGGLAEWAADPATPPIEGRMLTWLQNFLASRPDRPSLHLGYGEADRFARGHRLLAQQLPAGHVTTHAGGHDWETWLVLWRALLDNPSFAAQLDDTASRPI